MELALKDVINSRGGKWDVGTTLDAKCTYSVKITDSGFETSIVMENTGSEAWDFQILFHTYYGVTDRKALNGALCNVVGLEGYTVTDKVTGEKDYVLGSDPVTVPEGCIDRVHTPPSGKLDLNVTIAAGPGNKLSLTAYGDVDGTKVPVSGVVWNPNKEKAEGMGDFGNDQYQDMICVEPGLLSDVPVLEGGKKATFTQVISSLSA